MTLGGTLAGCGQAKSPPPKSEAASEARSADARAEPTPSRAAAFRALDAVGALRADIYDPRPVIAAINLLQPLGREAGTATLAAYIKQRNQQVFDRDGLFAVIRVLYEPPTAAMPYPKDACTPRQIELLSGPCLRPPRLGAPQPPAPEQLRSLRYPFFVLGDVPLSVVLGYSLGGKAEPLYMHFEALAAAPTGWLAKPLAPKSAGEIRYLFTHYGQWSANSEIGVAIDKQLMLLEKADRP